MHKTAVRLVLCIFACSTLQQLLLKLASLLHL